MEKWIKIALYGFVLVTGLIAGTGLLLMDSTLKTLLNPVMIDQAPDLDEELSAVEMKIRIDDDMSLNSLYVEVPDSQFVVFYCHDCNGHLFHHMDMIKAFKDMGLSVLAIDYRGFGLSDPTEISDETFLKDVTKAYSALRRKKWSSSQILFYGQGISAGIQGEFLKKNQCAAWVLDNPVPSLQDSTSNPIRQMLTVDRLSVYPALQSLKARVMVAYDPNIVSESNIEKLKSHRPDIKFCECEGDRSRSDYSRSDWVKWNDCMSALIRVITPPVPVTPSGKKGLPERKPNK